MATEDSFPYEEDSFPYEYGSDLHRLWGWGHRIESLLAKEGHIPSEHDWMAFRPSLDAANAMMRFCVDYTTVIQTLENCLSSAEEAFVKLKDNRSEHTEFVMADRMDVLSSRIRVAAQLIAERTTGKTEDSGNLPEIEVNEKLLQTRCDGNVYDLTDAQTVGMKALVDANGDWVSWSGLEISKPSRVKDSLPEPLKELIETEKGKGYRLKRT